MGELCWLRVDAGSSMGELNGGKWTCPAAKRMDEVILEISTNTNDSVVL